jgi:hypothetical protein
MHRTSYWKTITVALTGAALSFAVLLWLHSATLPQAVALVAYLFTACLLVATLLTVSGGLVCLWRDTRESSGKPDLFARFANQDPKDGPMPGRRFRLFRGPKLRPGDFVQVKARQDIAATLDDEGTLEGLPFMGEMEAYCGKIFRVHRRVDKINDMRNKTGLRRLRDTVTLSNVRCFGSLHGGCEAECQILWKDSWLKMLPAAQPAIPAGDLANRFKLQVAGASDEDPQKEYVCQMTQLWEASHAMSRFDLRQDLRPLLVGNLGLRGYVIAILTRIFNRAQSLRGGIAYPFMPESQVAGSTPLTSLGLRENDAVVIRSKHEIGQTLINSKNRGLWFDREMIRFCGQRAVVRKRVSRIIHEATKKMVVMKTPCVTLEKVIATGEFLRLCPQHEYIFWRETWLKRDEEHQPDASA